MSTTKKIKPENAIAQSVYDFLIEQENHFAGGLPVVQSEWVQEYLDQFAGMKRAILDEAEAKGLDPQLIEILERFLNLTDERNADGSIERRMLRFHIRLSQCISMTILKAVYSKIEKSVMEYLIAMDFNKESVCNYYRQQVPVMKKNGIIQNQDPMLAELSKSFKTLIMQFFPGDVITYDLTAKSLRECIDEAAADVAF